MSSKVPPGVLEHRPGDLLLSWAAADFSVFLFGTKQQEQAQLLEVVISSCKDVCTVLAIKFHKERSDFDLKLVRRPFGTLRKRPGLKSL